MKNEYRIFLASSYELKPERLEFESFINRENKRLAAKNVFLRLEIWEDMEDAFNTTNKQEDYNQYLQQCHLFVMLFWSKVGKFTRQEFDLAYKLYHQNGLPRIYVYEKTTDKPTATDADKASKAEFLKYLLQEGKEQFQSQFDVADTFIRKFEDNLHDLFEDKDNATFVYGEPAITLSSKGVSEPNVFFGREEELKAIKEKLDKGGKLMLINAEGGIGKTTLAAKYWHESMHTYKHNAWLFCEGGIVNALKDLAPKLNIDLSNMDETQQIEALRLGLSSVQNDFLLVLDNANDEKEIQVFKQHFEGFHWHVLITSRCHKVLEPEQEYEIKHLPPPIAKALFEKYYKEPSPDFDNLLNRLLKAINYHTLLVEIFAKNIKAAKSITTMQEFLEKLEAGGLHLAGDSFEIQTVYTTYVKKEAATTDAILDILYDFTKLEDTHRNVLLNLAFLPAEAYTIAYFYKIFGITEKEDKKAYKTILTDLHKKGWLNEEDDIYRLSPVIQKLALEKNAKTLGQDAQPLLDRLNAILANDGFDLTHISLTEAQDYVKPIFHLTKSLQNHPSWDIANYNFSAGIYFQNIGDIVSTKACYTNYGEIYKTLLLEDSENLSYKNGLAISYSELGVIYEATGDWKNALINYQEQLRIFKEIYESSPENLSYKNGLAISYSKLGGIYEATGDWKNALINYQEQLRIFKEIYESNPENLSYKNGLAISYSNLGGIYEATGDWKNALINYQARNRIGEEIYESSPENLSYKNGLAISYSKLGDIYEATGDWKNALINYQARNRIGEEIYESSPENLSYKNGLAISYEKLGGIYEATGDWKNALINYQARNRIGEEIYESSPENLSYKHGLATSYSKLGGIYEATGDWKNALINYQESNRIGKEIYESSPENLSYKNGLAISYSKLGDIYEATDDWKNALINYQEQLRIFKEIYESSPENLSYKHGLATSYSKLGGIYEATGDWKNALINYQEQLRIFKEIYESSPENLSYKHGLATSLARLGTFYLNRNDLGKALNHFLESRTLFAELWQSTQGQIIQFTFYFALNTQYTTDIVKHLIQTQQYAPEVIPELSEQIKQMRREGYQALKPLAEAGTLKENQKGLLQILSDEAWYEF